MPQAPCCIALAVECGVRLRSYAVLPGTNVFDRKAKRMQRDRAAARSDSRDCDYLVCGSRLNVFRLRVLGSDSRDCDYLECVVD